MRVKSDVEYLRQIPLFAEVDAAHLQVLAFSTRRRTIKKDSYVFREGKEATAGYVVVEGTVQMLRGPTKSAVPVAEATAGALIGETAMLAGMPYSLSALALSEVVVLRIPRKLLFEVAEEFPDFAFKLTKAVSAKLDGNLKDLNEVQSVLGKAANWSR